MIVAQVLVRVLEVVMAISTDKKSNRKRKGQDKQMGFGLRGLGYSEGKCL